MNRNLTHYKINYQITAAQLRLLDEEGKQIGVVSKLEALQKAREHNLDIVEIAPNAKPPVAKLIDFKKFKYQEARKERESKKNQKNVGIKAIKLRPFIGEHDFDYRLKQAKEFLAEGNQVKINVVFKGRELGRKEFGFSVIRRFIEQANAKKVVREPHMEGRVLSATIVGESEETHAKNENKENRSKPL